MSFLLLIFISAVSLHLSTGEQSCPVDTDQCHVIPEQSPQRSHVTQWITSRCNWKRKLVIVTECTCDHKPDTKITEQLVEISENTNTEVGVVSFTYRGHTTNYSTTWNDVAERCGSLCAMSSSTNASATITKYGKRVSSFKTMLQLISEIITLEKTMALKGAEPELHFIVLTARHIDKNVIQYPKEMLHPLITSLIDVSDKDHVTYHFIIDPSSQTLIGDPKQSVIYKDHTHFNKALTLTNLLSSGQGECLQSHVLSHGLTFQVSYYSMMKNIDMLYSLNPALWDPLPLNIKYKNVCININCTNYCSSLHGCIVDTDITLPTERHSLSAVKFKTSHADVSVGNAIFTDSNLTSVLSIVQSPFLPDGPNFSINDVIVGEPEILSWYPWKPFISDVIAKNRPVVLQSTVVTKWTAMTTWNMSYVADTIGMDVMNYVKCTNSYLTFDPDNSVPLKLNLSLPYTLQNMTKEMFFKCVQEPCPDGYKGHYYFGTVPENLKQDISPDSYLYHTERDTEAKRQYIWISSAGMITHGHFDQDYNIFIQLVGKKRFTLWSPDQHSLLYMYPRVHPLWHKSRINFRQPDLYQFPYFSMSRGLQVIVNPGDILYIPPYTWHYVETLSPSISLSTWSHDYDLYDHMNAIYGHDHKFDLIADTRGQLFALRLYLDMLIQDLYGFNETTHFFAKLLATRFNGLEHHFPPKEDDPLICGVNEIPLCYHVHGYVTLDVKVIGSHFKALVPEVMDILFQDYIEEISTQVVGVQKMLAFFQYCFRGQKYYITESGDPEHSIWDYIDSHDS